MCTIKNRLCQKSTLSSYPLRLHVRPASPPHHKYDHSAACQRYDSGGSVVLTSNKAFSEWAHVFNGDAVMAGAALDRLLHKATVLSIRGDSYRLRERKKARGCDDLLTNPQPKA